MSGSGGSGYGGGFERSGASCEDLVINTQISSPQAAVVSALQVGTLLDVVIQQHGTMTVVALLYNGRLAGGVASPDVQRLRDCIESGTIYQARVTNISGAHIGVRIAVP